MYKLILNTKKCISCGICQDVCKPEAIDMHMFSSSGIEGKYLVYWQLKNRVELESQPKFSFPFMKNNTCDGCANCVFQCPTDALAIEMI